MANGPGYIESFLASEVSQEVETQQNKQFQLTQKAFNVLQSSLYSDPDSDTQLKFNQDEAVQKLEILEKTSLDPQFKTSAQQLLDVLKNQLVEVHSTQELKLWIQQMLSTKGPDINKGIHVQLSTHYSPIMRPLTQSENDMFHKKKHTHQLPQNMSPLWVTRLLKKLRTLFARH